MAKVTSGDSASSPIAAGETSSSDSPDKFDRYQVQKARIALLEHHTSQMQAYVDRGLALFGALLALFAAYFQFQNTLSENPMTVFIIFVALGFLCGCILFSIARFARYGMTVRAATKAPLKVKQGGSQTVLGQLDTCIGEWAEQEIENEAKGEWSKKWTWKLWRLLCDIGGNQIKSLSWSGLLWLVVIVVACWIALINPMGRSWSWLALSDGIILDANVWVPLFSALLSVVITLLIVLLVEPRKWRYRYNIRSTEKSLAVYGWLISIVRGCQSKAARKALANVPKYLLETSDIPDLEDIFGERAYLLSEGLRQTWYDLQKTDTYSEMMKVKYREPDRVTEEPRTEVYTDLTKMQRQAEEDFSKLQTDYKKKTGQ